MILEEVARILKLNLELNGRKMPKDTATALGIAIEAVKARKKRQDQLTPQLRSLLPGETIS